jgi:hypothetical protein
MVIEIFKTKIKAHLTHLVRIKSYNVKAKIDKEQQVTFSRLVKVK